MLNIGDTLRSIREKKNFTLLEVADRSGISKSYLSKIENRMQSPSIEYLEKICLGLNIPVSIFMILADDTIGDFSDLTDSIKSLIYESL